MKVRSIFFVFCLMTLVFFSQVLMTPTTNQGPAVQTIGLKLLPKDMGKCPGLRRLGILPLSFEANMGQTEDPVKFLSRGSKYTLYLASSEAVLELHSSKSSSPASLRIKFEGGNVSPQVSGENKLSGVSNYFIGNDPGLWRTKVPHYAKIRYKEVFPGVDLVFHGENQQLEFDFICAPGARLSSIGFVLEGTKKLDLGRNGDLSADLGGGKVVVRHPHIYQGLESEAEDIGGRFILIGQNRVGFEVDAYDPDRTLIIDPILSYSTFFGVGGGEGADSLVEDEEGNIYFCTTTNNTSFPTVKPYQPSYGGYLFDGFVGKLNATGNAMVYATYLGGSGRDEANDIAVDALGNAYVIGSTDSPNFPLVNPLQPNFGGSSVGLGDAFVTKLNSDGSALLYSTYLGGSADEQGQGIAVDEGGYAYVMGNTCSKNFPTKNAFQKTLKGEDDVFLAKLDATGTALVYSTFLGGSSSDCGYGFGQGEIDIDDSGCAYLTGFTFSGDFPIKNAFQPKYGGGGEKDAFITKFNPSGSSLVFSTYLGGSLSDHANAIAVAPNGIAGVTGSTRSTDFPTQNPFQRNFSGGTSDAFVAVINPDGSSLFYSTYLGGSGDEGGHAIAVSPFGNFGVIGGTTSANFPVVNAIQGSRHGEGDIFVIMFDSVGSNLLFSTYLGGGGNEAPGGIGFDIAGNMFLGGGTNSSDFPTVNAFQPTFGGETDIFISRIRMEPQGPVPKLTSLSPSSSDAGDPDFDLKLKGSNFLSGAVAVWDGSIRPTTFVSSTELTAVINSADLEAGKVVQVAVTNPGGGLSNALPFSIRNPAPMLTAISPNKAMAGESDFLLTLTGSSFVPNSVVRWNSEDKATTYISGTTLKATIPAANLATGGDVQVTVNNPKPAGGSSDALSFKIADFAISASPSSVTVSPGLSAVYQVNLNPLFGSYDTAVSLSCSGKPSECTSSFSQASVTPGSNGATSTLTLVTKSSFTALIERFVGSIGHIPLKLELALLLMVLILLFLMRTLGSWGRRPLLAWVRIAAIACVFILLASCGGGDGGEKKMGGTPAGTYTITIAGKVGSLERTTTVTLIVK